jgi:predicted alpha/beta-hydrolase family hydrolase
MSPADRPISSSPWRSDWHDAEVASGQQVREIETPSGLARAQLRAPRRVSAGTRGLVVIGHGAGGGIDAPDLVAVADALLADGWGVGLVEQPYRVKGHRAPAPAPQLDAAWIAVTTALRRSRRQGSLVVAGRSSGARVACRTAKAVGADAVVALAFPLHPPGKPEKSRASELLGVAVPTLVIQGERDPFGSAADLPAGPTIVGVPGDHSLRRAAGEAAAAIVAWLAGIGSTVGVLERL